MSDMSTLSLLCYLRKPRILRKIKTVNVLVDADKPRRVRRIDARSDRREAGEGAARAPGTPAADAEGAAPALEGPHRLPGSRQCYQLQGNVRLLA